MKAHTKTMFFSILLAGIALSAYPEDKREKNVYADNSSKNYTIIAFNTTKNPNVK